MESNPFVRGGAFWSPSHRCVHSQVHRPKSASKLGKFCSCLWRQRWLWRFRRRKRWDYSLSLKPRPTIETILFFFINKTKFRNNQELIFNLNICLIFTWEWFKSPAYLTPPPQPCFKFTPTPNFLNNIFGSSKLQCTSGNSDLLKVLKLFNFFSHFISVL